MTACFLAATIATLIPHVTCKPQLVISPEGPLIRRPVKKAFVLTCKGEGEDPKLFTDFKWYDPNGNEILQRSRYPSSNSETSESLNHHNKVRSRQEGDKLLLIFREPTANDGGVYICRSRFQVSVSLTAQIETHFYQDVTFENCPTSQSLVKGRSDGFIRCGVSANPPPILTWLKDDRPLSEDRYVIENTGIRVRGVIEESDAGRYDVNARVEETGEVLYQLITVEVYGE